jgi:hypothetical protein
MKRVNAYAQEHGRVVAAARFGVGISLLGLAAWVCFAGIWWGALFLAPAALHFYLGYRALSAPSGS